MYCVWPVGVCDGDDGVFAGGGTVGGTGSC